MVSFQPPNPFSPFLCFLQQTVIFFTDLKLLSIHPLFCGCVVCILILFDLYPETSYGAVSHYLNNISFSLWQLSTHYTLHLRNIVFYYNIWALVVNDPNYSLDLTVECHRGFFCEDAALIFTQSIRIDFDGNDFKTWC